MRVALPSRKNLQPATIATRPTANDGAYEPVRSYTNPASAGPSPAPLRQPSPTTLMIVASAARPNAVSASDACASGTPRSRAYATLCTVTIMYTKPRKPHDPTKYQRRRSPAGQRAPLPAVTGRASADGG